MLPKRKTAGAHRRDETAPEPAAGVVRERERWTARAEAERRAEADAITERLGGWVLVMWSRRCRAFLAFGWWGYPPMVGRDRREIEGKIRAAYARGWPGGR